MMTLLICAYFLCVVWLALYGLNCHVLNCIFRRRAKKSWQQAREVLERFYQQGSPLDNMHAAANMLPVVTTQLPVYNERNVIERLLDAVAAFHYPQGKHEIQVLDDSTDETRHIVARKVAQLKRQGVDIHHITRDRRTGFKAGALAAGLTRARGEFTAIFDADFIPPADFLLHAMPFFVKNPRIGFIQGRWGHLNPRENLITRLQSVGINGHHMIEQCARSGGNLFLNFNGTAGVFRKAAILDAGNWQGDTLTEDLDLSYRIQLAGWQCRYLVDLVASAEIPSNINAFKQQQFRWAKGSIQTALKILPAVCSSATLSTFVKIQAVMHLTHYMVHPLMLFQAVMALPILLLGHIDYPPAVFLVLGMVLLCSASGPSCLYLTAEGALKNSVIKTLVLLPAMISFGCGLAVSNTRAVIEALVGYRSNFVRTPKQGFSGAKTYRTIPSRIFVIEIFMGLWCLAGVVAYFRVSYYIVGHFLLLYACGFIGMGWLSWRMGKN